MANGFITFSFMIWNSKTWVLIWAVSCENLGGESLNPDDPENNVGKLISRNFSSYCNTVKGLIKLSGIQILREINISDLIKQLWLKHTRMSIFRFNNCL